MNNENRYSIGAAPFVAPNLPAGLYLVATPIGNLKDVTLRALEVMAAADTVYCEDTRVTSRLLERYGIRNRLRPCHDHTEGEMAAQVAEAVASGKAVAFASDAGTPLISDPGFRLVEACIARHLPVIALPGASAILPALQASGLATDQFQFLGFLPHKTVERRHALQSCVMTTATLIAYESPHRLIDTLADIAAVLGERRVSIGRELTKLHEETLRGTASSLREELAVRESIKGECVVVIEGADKAGEAMDDRAVLRVLADAAAALPASKAAAQAAKLTGLSRDEAFRRILELKART